MSTFSISSCIFCSNTWLQGDIQSHDFQPIILLESGHVTVRLYSECTVHGSLHHMPFIQSASEIEIKMALGEI